MKEDRPHHRRVLSTKQIVTNRDPSNNVNTCHVLNDPQRCHEYFIKEFAKSQKRTYCIAYYDDSPKLIHSETLSAIYEKDHKHPYILMRKAGDMGAYAILLGHNTNTNFAFPQRTDCEIVSTLVSSMNKYKVRVFDYIIVSNTTYFSFSSAGEIKNISYN